MTMPPVIIAWCLMSMSSSPILKADTDLRVDIDLSGNGWRLWLDRDADWRNDPLFLPPVTLADLPVNEPSGGWSVLNNGGVEVAVPGTVEGLLWDELGGDYVGVSWWYRDIDLPTSIEARRVSLEFAAVRQRAEVFVNDVLVGYDAVGNTPFSVDLTGRVRAGRNRVAIRITDPGGNFDWRDYNVLHWGEHTLPMSHGFGGITGSLHLIATAPIRIDDVFVRNTPEVTDAVFEMTLSNASSSVIRDLRIRVRDSGGECVFDQTWRELVIASGDSEISRRVSIPGARPWSPDAPNLYVAEIEVVACDRVLKRFGFRWFSVDEGGNDARLRLNGKRVVLRSAISWGIWPIGGMVPSPAMARRNVEIAKALGLNMLNLHRCIGDEATFDAADELGLLLFEEPGGYTSHGGDETCFAFAREKLMRMVRRDRSRPSLVIYNMINEETPPPGERHRRDMTDAHALDPTRTILFTSGWAKDGDDPSKLHMLPLDQTQRTFGWYDVHHAPGPGVYRDAFYRSPDAFRWMRAENREIVFWGEDGAIATPPRLGRIVDELAGMPNGWDGADYRAWHAAFEKFLDDKHMRAFFPTVDGLTESLGNIAFYYQCRLIENIRLGDTTDGYVINGWESEKLENHSGIVDCFRNPKGNPELLARYNRPLHLAVKLRSKVGTAPMDSTCDVFIINEVGLRGTFELTLWLTDECDVERWRNRFDVTMSGGERYGELLLRDLSIRIDGAPGRYRVCGALRKRTDGVTSDEILVEGHDEVCLLKPPAAPTSTNGAVLDISGVVNAFTRDRLHFELPTYHSTLLPLDYIILADGGELIRFDPIPAEMIILPDGSGPGLVGDYFQGWEFERFVFTRIDQGVQHDFGSTGPDPRLGGRDYSVRWRGRIRPTESGPYIFHAEHDDGVRIFLDNREIIGHWDPFAGPPNDSGHAIQLEAGRDYELRIEYFQSGNGARMRLYWATPTLLRQHDAIVESLMKRVKEDGTTLIVLSNTDQWAELFAQHGAVEYEGRMNHGRFWLGGCYFVRLHPLFHGLPVNGAMNWEYQEIVNYDRRRYGLRLKGEEVVVGCVTGNEHEVATAVGIVRLGKGRIVLSTLDILPLLNDPSGPADVARAILCNYMRYASLGGEGH
ncbi:MAG: hypothetical protein H6818_02490 [Phycisphaerales bacterium]|nr:hypothetical protein [Phycisphaerales bacterium]MCB9863183.1 hypothetical protein [Phycisphaerales bacterium]